MDVYFDDVKMSYTPGNIVQSNEYYAHGLPTANSWTRDNAVANNFLANGGTELNSTSQLYDLDFRNFDPVLGRLTQVDPMTDKYSSVSAYHFSFNNPVSYTDVNGADPNGNGFVHPPDEPYDWFGFNSNMGRDQAYNHGGASGGQIRYDGSGGYFQDTNGNGVQDSGEEMGTGWFKQTTTYQITHTFDGEVIASYKQYETEYFYVDPLTSPGPGYGWLKSPVGNAGVNSAFPLRNDGVTPHSGTDYNVNLGTEVKVTASGKVVKVETDFPGYGMMVVVDHGLAVGGGNVYTLYAHGSSTSVSVGDTVDMGDVIMLSGSSGSSSGPHLHYEVINTVAGPNDAAFYQNMNIRYGPSSLGSFLGEWTNIGGN